MFEFLNEEKNASRSYSKQNYILSLLNSVKFFLIKQLFEKLFKFVILIVRNKILKLTT